MKKKTVTTPEQFLAEMQEIRTSRGGDEEAAHGEMDKLLCRVLKELGYAEGILVFDDQDKWYA